MDTKLQESKVDNVTMQLMIEKQLMMMLNYKETLALQKETLRDYKQSVDEMRREIQAERMSRDGRIVIMNEPVKVKK